MKIGRSVYFQLFKYTVYALLTLDIYWFFADEYLAAQLQFAGGMTASDVIEAYASTIDTTAWVVLLLMFELETYVLEDRHFTRPVTWTLHSLRGLCYAFIVYAFYGYIVNLTFLDAVSPLADVNTLCALAADGWSYATGIDEFVDITPGNCSALSAATGFVQFNGLPAVVDVPGLRELRGLAWIDVINSAVWLLVVVVLEIDVWLQEHDRYEGLTFAVSAILKVVLYATLFYAAVYWGIKGDFVDFWDAFLWLVAFVFIELNVFEWHMEEAAGEPATRT